MSLLALPPNLPRPTPRFLPEIVIYEPPTRDLTPFYRDWMVDTWKDGATLPPAQASGVLWLKLGEETDFDGMPGMPRKITPSALICDYEIGFRPTRATHWTRIPSPQEAAWLALDRDLYRVQLDELAVDLAQPNVSQAQREKLTGRQRDVQATFDQLNSGSGYLQTSDGALGTRTTGIFWGLTAANVPVELRETLSLDEDRAISFRLKRSKAPEEQAAHNFVVEIDAGFTCYALSMGGDGNSSEFWHYRNMSRVQRAQLRAQLDVVLDFGRLTVADRRFILDLENEARTIRATAKARQQDKRDLTLTESARLDAIDRAIETRRDKHLTAAQESLKTQLENKLFLARESFQLQENAQELIGRTVDVTLQFLRAGYVIVKSGATKWIYENKRLTAMEPPAYRRALPRGAHLSIRSDGGKWHFSPGAPQWKPGIVSSAPFESQQSLSGRAQFLLDGDAVGDATLAPRLLELRAPTPTQVGLYQVEVELLSEGRHTAELYYVGLHCPGEAGVPGAVVWDSRAVSERLYTKSRVLDLVVQDDKRRARLVSGVISLAQSVGSEPHLRGQTGGLALDALLFDRWSGQTVIFLKHGYIQSDERGRLGALETASGWASVPLAGNEAVVEAIGCEGFLNRPLTALVPGNGLFPNDYVRLLCRDAGLPPALWARIPAGDAGWRRIPPPHPGQYPSARPSAGTTYLETVRDTVSNHCFNGEFRSDGQGLLLDRWSARDRPDLSFGTPSTGVPVESLLCLRGNEGFTLKQDLRGYVTSASFIGAKNRATGQRFAGTENLPQASDRRFANSVFHIGHEVPFVAPVDETLTDEAACIRAARQFLHITNETPDGLAPIYPSAQIDFNPDLACNDLVRVFDVKFVVDSIEFAALNAGDGQRARIGFQLAQDLNLAQVAQIP